MVLQGLEIGAWNGCAGDAGIRSIVVTLDVEAPGSSPVALKMVE